MNSENTEKVIGLFDDPRMKENDGDYFRKKVQT